MQTTTQALLTGFMTLGLGIRKKRHPGCKHKIPVHKDHVMKVDVAFFPLIYALTASVLSRRFKFFHFIHINDKGFVCDSRTSARGEGCRASKKGLRHEP